MPIATTDPIADMLTRMRNAALVGKHEVKLPHSNIKEALASILKANNFIDEVSVEPQPVGKLLSITLNQPNKNSRITEINRLSRPGRRQYVGAGAIPVVKSGRGLVVISTSKGLMSGNEAKSQSLGGELICSVY